MFVKLYSFVKNHTLGVFISLILLGIVLHCTTLSYSPLPWMDEVQTNEIVRGGIAQKSSTWNMAIVRSDGGLDEQSWALYYLGGLSSELGYILFGRAGDRILNLFWLLLSTICVSFYFYKKTNRKNLSYLVGLLYFSFPPLIQSVRGGRADVLAFTFLFASLAILQLQVKINKRLYLLCILSSCLAVLSIFSWITAILCMPIVLWEALETFKRYNLKFKQQFYMLLLMALSGIGMMFILLSPFLIHYKTTVDTFLYILAHNSSVSTGAPYIKALIKALIAIPGLYCLGLLVLCLKKRFFLLTIASFMICFIAVMTYCYVFRILYLLPYVLIGVALSATYIKSLKKQCLYFVMLIGMCVATYGYSILLRNGTEYFAKDVRDAQVLKDVLKREIGENKKIYCDTFQLYYVGRELNWEQYRLASRFPAEGIIIEKLEIEYYITEKSKLTKQVQDDLKKNNFVFVKEIRPFDLENLSSIEKFLQNHGRLTSYGPYYLYAKEK